MSWDLKPALMKFGYRTYLSINPFVIVLMNEQYIVDQQLMMEQIFLNHWEGVWKTQKVFMARFSSTLSESTQEICFRLEHNSNVLKWNYNFLF